MLVLPQWLKHETWKLIGLTGTNDERNTVLHLSAETNKDKLTNIESSQDRD